MANVEYSQLAFLVLAMGFQIYAVTMSQRAWYGTDFPDVDTYANKIASFMVQGCMIGALVLYLISFILGCLLTYGELGNHMKKMLLVVIVLVGLAAMMVVVGLALYGLYMSTVDEFSMTAYVTGMVLCTSSGVFYGLYYRENY